MNNELEQWQDRAVKEWCESPSDERSDLMWNIIERAATIFFIATLALLASCVGYDEMHALPNHASQEVAK